MNALTQDLVCEVKGNLGFVTLNRPRALNALTLDMVRGIGGPTEPHTARQDNGVVISTIREVLEG